MKFSDFFINGRYFFGFVLPGAMWIVALVLLLMSPDCVGDFIKTARPGQWVALLIAGLLVGHAIGPYCFNLVKWLSGIMHNRLPLLNLGPERERLDGDGSSRAKELKSRVKDIIRQRYGDEEYYLNLSDNDLHLFCKRTVLEKTEKLFDKLAEFENEVNLRAMFVLPLLALAAAWWWKVPVYHWIVPLLLAVAALLLCTRVYPVVCDEYKSVYEMFLLVTDKPVAPGGSPPDSGHNNVPG